MPRNGWLQGEWLPEPFNIRSQERRFDKTQIWWPSTRVLESIESHGMITWLLRSDRLIGYLITQIDREPYNWLLGYSNRSRSIDYLITQIDRDLWANLIDTSLSIRSVQAHSSIKSTLDRKQRTESVRTRSIKRLKSLQESTSRSID